MNIFLDPFLSFCCTIDSFLSVSGSFCEGARGTFLYVSIFHTDMIAYGSFALLRRYYIPFLLILDSSWNLLIKAPRKEVKGEVRHSADKLTYSSRRINWKYRKYVLLNKADIYGALWFVYSTILSCVVICMAAITWTLLCFRFGGRSAPSSSATVHCILLLSSLPRLKSEPLQKVVY